MLAGPGSHTPPARMPALPVWRKRGFDNDKNVMWLLRGFDKDSDKFWKGAAAECRRRLTEQRIGPGAPGTMLMDVDTLLEAVGPEGIPTKSRNASLPLELLPALNLKMSHPVKLELDRPLLRDYPNLAGIFILLRSLDLLQKKGPRLILAPTALERWQGLNAAERYFALLDALLFQAQTSMLGGESRREENNTFEDVTFFLCGLRENWRNFKSYEASDTLSQHGEIPPWNLFVQQQLGLIEIRPASAALRKDVGPGTRGWIAGGAKLTPWGAAMAWGLLQCLNTYEHSLDEQSAAEEDEGAEPLDEQDRRTATEILHPTFRPFFPEWRTIYERPKHEAPAGTYLFKVTLAGWRGGAGDIWRRIAIPGFNSLDSLANAILKAFKLDDDHAYDFRYRDERGKNRIINHPLTDEGPFTPEVQLNESGLLPGGKMTFVFDYGDHWEFHLRLERIDPNTKEIYRPTVIESAGTPPPQYPICD